MVEGTGIEALAEAAAEAETETPSAAGMAMTAAAGVVRNTSITISYMSLDVLLEDQVALLFGHEFG